MTTPGATTPMRPDLLADHLDAFAGAYGFLSRLLIAAPDADLVARLGAPGLLDAWPMAADEPTVRGRELLATAVGREELTALVRDYDRLFVGPGPLLAAPYESVHRTRERLVFEAPTMQVREVYRAFGLQAPRLNREPDDHIGLELHFLAELCTRGLDAIEAGDEFTLDTTLAGQQSFLSEHVLLWGPDLLTLVAHHAQTDFYRGVAALGTGLLEQARATFVA